MARGVSSNLLPEFRLCISPCPLLARSPDTGAGQSPPPPEVGAEPSRSGWPSRSSLETLAGRRGPQQRNVYLFCLLSGKKPRDPPKKAKKKKQKGGVELIPGKELGRLGGCLAQRHGLGWGVGLRDLRVDLVAVAFDGFPERLLLLLHRALQLLRSALKESRP